MTRPLRHASRFLALTVALTPAVMDAAPPVIDYDWENQPVSGYTNFERSWEAGSTTTLQLPFSTLQPLSPSTAYDGPVFFGAASVVVGGSLDGTTPAAVKVAHARVSNQTEGDDLEMRISSDPLSSGGEVTLDAAALFLFRAEAPFALGDTSLRYVNGNRSNGGRFQWVIQLASGGYYVSDMSIAIKGTGTEFLSNSLTSRGWATLDVSSENLLEGIGNYRSPSEIGLDFSNVIGAGILATQSNTQADSGAATFYATVREFEVFRHDPLRDQRHLSSYYFGNSLTGSTYPEGHDNLGASVGKSWEAIAKLGAGWQLWQHRFELYNGADLGGVANGDYTLDPSQQGDSASLIDQFLSEPWEAMVLQAFGNVMWDETVQAGEEKFDITFEETTNVGDPQSADDLIAAYLALNPEGKVFLYTNWHNMPMDVVPPYNEWPAWTETYAKADELVPGEPSSEFPDRDAFHYDDLFFDFYQVEDPPWHNNRNWTRDYHNQLFEEIARRYPQLWAEGRLGAIPLGEIFRRLDRIYQNGGDPELNNPSVTEKIVRIADFYADRLHVRGGMAQFTCAATFYAVLYDEHPGSLDWTLYNDPANWGDDPTHDATPILPITEARAAQVCDVIWDVLTSHPYTLQRIAPFQGEDVAKPGMASIWGSNSHGQIGREEIVGNRTSPIPLEDDVTVLPGGLFAFAISDNGDVLAFGQNHRGQLGDSTQVNRRYPYEVTLLPNVRQIAAGTNHAAAVTSGGGVFAWGSNNHGELGDDFGRFGDATNEFPNPPQNPSPRRVNGVSDATMVACGNGFTLALLSNGTVMAWGQDGYGQLGDGSPQGTGNSTPTTIPGLTSIIKIAAAGDFALALRSNGTVYAWGRNHAGQLGLGDTVDRSTPTQISALSGIVDIAAGDAHALAVDSNGTVYTWGSNSDGQLALSPATNPERASPATRNFAFDVTAVAAGRAHSLALTSDGRVYAWGANHAGQLGIGSTTSQSSPQWITALSNIKEIAAGGDLSSAKRMGTPQANQAPTVDLTLPAAAANDEIVPFTITSADADGTVVRVEIFVNGQPLSRATQEGDGTSWSFNWHYPANGNYSIRARATDNDGTSSLSPIRSLSVSDPAGDGDPGPQPEPEPGENPVIDASFDDGVTVASSWLYSSDPADVGTGWQVQSADGPWTSDTEGGFATNSGRGAPAMAQIIHDQGRTTGLQNVMFRLANQFPGNIVEFYIWGVNEAFGLNLYERVGPRNGTANIANGGVDGAELLADRDLNQGDDLGDLDHPDFVTVSYDNASGADNRVNFGTGYEYLVVLIYVQGATGEGEYVRVDDVVIGGTAPEPDPEPTDALLETFDWADGLGTGFPGNTGTIAGVDGLQWTYNRVGEENSKSITGVSLLLQRRMSETATGWIEAPLPSDITGLKLTFRPRYNGQSQIRVSLVDVESFNSVIANGHDDTRTFEATVSAPAGTLLRIESIGPSSNKDVIIDDLELLSSDSGGGDKDGDGTTLQPTDDHNTTTGDGTSDTMSAVSEWNRFAMKFDLGSVGQVASATLRVYRRDSDTAANTVEVYAGRTDAWSESSPNADIPIETGGVLDSVNSPGGGQWLEFDVTDLVAAEAAGDGTATLVLRTRTGTWNTFVHTRQNPNNPPELIINGGGS